MLRKQTYFLHDTISNKCLLFFSPQSSWRLSLPFRWRISCKAKLKLKQLLYHCDSIDYRERWVPDEYISIYLYQNTRTTYTWQSGDIMSVSDISVWISEARLTIWLAINQLAESLSLSLSLSLCFYLFICLSICLHVWVPAYLRTCLCACAFVCVCLRVCVCGCATLHKCHAKQ